jgi:hypothetical protein
MKRVYSTANPLLISHMRNLLETAGIRCQIRNLGLAGAAGELPPTAIWPELWVERPIDYVRATALVAEALGEPAAGPDWRCGACGEQLETQFDCCWRCETPRRR